ncbi:MAG: alpha/beta hydrolase fold domain-containing protein [bacterium]|nr:alpha/beta hydrolase fold domain-containing protein [bacterium]
MTQIVWIDSPSLNRHTAQMQRTAAEIAAAQREGEPLEELGVAEARRRYYEGGGGFGPNVVLDGAETIAVDDHVELRVFTPPRSRGVYLMIHSGGWLSGGPDLQDRRMMDLALSAETTVACVRYRLAPEHPHPAAVDDCETAALWLLEHGSSLCDAAGIVIGGESAGAHLAALTLLRLRDAHRCADRIAGANLVYGIFDLSLSPSARLAGPEGLVLPTPTLRFMVDTFLADPGINRQDPAVSPLFADLSGLVPARFVVGEFDPVLDDTLMMGVRWRAAGNPALIEVYPASVHAFDEFPTEMTRLASERQSRWIREMLSAP